MQPQTSEASTKAGPGVLLGGEHLLHSEFEGHSLAISQRCKVSIYYARAVLRLLRGGECA